MRVIEAEEITKNVREMCIEANVHLSEDMEKAVRDSVDTEDSPLGKQILRQLCENLDVAGENDIPICQDTGMAVFFVNIGQDVHIEGINITDAIIHYDIVPGENIEITIAPKGFGSENMSKVYMLKPADGEEGVKAAVIQAVKDAGPNACPPVFVGVGLGGDFELATKMAKKALTRKVGVHSDKEHIARIESELLEAINNTGIGPGGLGGKITALAVNIETYATHIAGMPLAVNMCCHVNRHVTRVL